MIRKEGKHYVLRAKGTGKLLGKHASMAEAMEQERAIEAAKRKRRGPKKKR